jgi:hypothetical protein
MMTSAFLPRSIDPISCSSPSVRAPGPSGHPQDLSRRQHARFFAHRLQNSREPHFFEHVEAVVAGCAVRAERDGDPSRPHLGTWRDA